jgi:Flp pilus assembly protein TadG
MMLDMQAKRRRGAMAIETALLFPLLVLLLFGMCEFGLYMYNQQVITNASREGARFGIVQRTPRYSDSEIENVVGQYCTDRLFTYGGGGSTPSINITRVGDTFGDDLTVRVTYQYTFLVLTNFGFGPKQMAAQTVMRME